MQLFWLSVGFGFVTASVLAIAAVGLSLQFGITNYVNFAYGDFMALGGFFAYVLNNQVLHLNIWIALVLGGDRDGRARGRSSTASSSVPSRAGSRAATTSSS